MNKLKLFPLLVATATCVSTSHATEATDESTIPTGELTVSAISSARNIKPELSWDIKHPAPPLEDLIDEKPNGDVKTKAKLKVEVSMLGTGITDNYGTQYPSLTKMKFGGSWKKIFKGKGSQVVPSQVLVTQIVPKDTVIKLKTKDASDDGYDYPWILSSSSEVKIFYNGDTPPSNPRSNAHASTAAEYMKPYIVNGKLALGAYDFIYAAEITHTSDNIDSLGYDLQDAIVHVRVTLIEE